MKLYLDTSIFGGYFEAEFQLWTQKLVEEILEGTYTAVVTDLTLFELEGAPPHVKDLADKVIATNAEFVIVNSACIQLADNYLKEKIVTSKYRSDALHIATATINKIDVVTSWNFKHIVNVNKIRLYNSVNLKYGHSMIDIRSPREIVAI